MKRVAEVEGFDDLDAMRAWFEHHHQRERITW
jgi:hypothetical protein